MSKGRIAAISAVLGVLVVGSLLSTTMADGTDPKMHESLEGSVPIALEHHDKAAQKRFGVTSQGLEQATPKLDIDLGFYPDTNNLVAIVGNGSYRIADKTYQVKILANQKIERTQVGARSVDIGLAKAECETNEGMVPCNLAVAHDVASDQTMINAAIGSLGEEVLIQFGTNPLTLDEVNALRTKQK